MTDGDTNPKFPFGFVQLAAFVNQRDHYTWPKLRYHQTSDYSYVPNDAMENTFMAVSMDTNDPQFDSLHPPHKVGNPRISFMINDSKYYIQSPTLGHNFGLISS